jgi:hypothetical protein
MKNIFLSLFYTVFVLSINSCSEHENLEYDGAELLHFDRTSQIVPDGNVSVTYGVTKPVGSDHTVELVFNQAKSTAILGTDITIVEGTDVLKSGSVLGDFRLNVTKAAAVAKKVAVFTVKSSTLANAVFNQEVTVSFSCPSALAGTYQYSTVNAFAPGLPIVAGPKTGTVTLTATSVGNEYAISDSSFGAYSVWSGYAPISTGIRLVDQCNTLSFAGANVQYGDTWAISNVVVSGNKLTFRWVTSYGEYATTTLTKSNGNWPALN